MEQRRMLTLWHQAIPTLETADRTQEAESSTDGSFLSSIQRFLLDPAQFVAGHLCNHLIAWQLFFDVFGHSSKAASAWTLPVYCYQVICYKHCYPCTYCQRAISEHLFTLSRVHVV